MGKYNISEQYRKLINRYKIMICILDIMGRLSAYRIQPNYRTVRIGFSKMLEKLVVKYVPIYPKGTLLKQLRKT